MKNEIRVKHLPPSPHQGNGRVSKGAVPPAQAGPSGVGDVAQLDPAGDVLEHPSMARGEEGTCWNLQPHPWWLRCFNPAPGAGLEAEMKPSPAPSRPPVTRLSGISKPQLRLLSWGASCPRCLFVPLLPYTTPVLNFCLSFRDVHGRFAQALPSAPQASAVPPLPPRTVHNSSSGCFIQIFP